MSALVHGPAEASPRPQPPLRLLWLEITGRCQLECPFCYAESGPRGTDGSMTTSEWLTTIDQAAEVGVGLIQFIGGEPTLHRDLGVMIESVLAHGVAVEVYSNLLDVPDRVWELLKRPGVRLATSYHSDIADEHDRIVGRKGAHARTEANIAMAVELGIPLRVNGVRVTPEQRVGAAEDRVRRLGVSVTRHDDLRGVGRGATGAPTGVDALCGRCVDGSLAIMTDGNAVPCVFARWPKMGVGNVKDRPLAELVGGSELIAIRNDLRAAFRQRAARNACDPACAPNVGCQPDLPCSPMNGDECDPTYCHPNCNPGNTG